MKRERQGDRHTETQRHTDRELELENFILQGLERERERESAAHGRAQLTFKTNHVLLLKLLNVHREHNY